MLLAPLLTARLQVILVCYLAMGEQVVSFVKGPTSHLRVHIWCRYGEKMGRMVRGVDSAYEELFAYACPKFITAAPPNLDAPTANTNQVCM